MSSWAKTDITNILQQPKLNGIVQPIDDMHRGNVFGHEALTRGPETDLHSPIALLNAAHSVLLPETEFFMPIVH
jgi:EAL domain-containing protein (putative c-di-GMP-specific phosphodiesterase class I)